MEVPWYERPVVRERLLLFGRAIQGPQPFAIVIEPDPARCHSACCSFATQRIVVNPTLFAVPPPEQYTLTKALLVHEAGHRRYTNPSFYPTVVGDLANILEDERIEARMCAEFRGVRWLIRKLAQRFYLDSRTLDATTDHPQEVLAYCLQLRWAQRSGQPLKGGLSPRNQQRWTTIQPLVLDAWQADCYQTVARLATQISEILGLDMLQLSHPSVINPQGGV